MRSLDDLLQQPERDEGKEEKQRVRSRLLTVPDVKGRDREESRRQERDRAAEPGSHDVVQHRDARNTEQQGRKPQGDLVPSERPEEVNKSVIQRRRVVI